MALHFFATSAFILLAVICHCSRAADQNASPCVDVFDNCANFGQQMCSNKALEDWAKGNCAKFCGYCLPPLTTAPRLCADKLQHCAAFGSHICTDAATKDWAKDNCNKHCGFCSVTTTTVEPCLDKVPNCAAYGSVFCSNNQYAKWRNQNCRKHCGLCATTTDQCFSDQSDIVLALDSSGSISISNWKVEKTFVKNLIASFDVSPNKIRVGALRFSDDVTNQFHLKDATTSKIALDGLDLMQHDGAGSKTHLAIKYMREKSFSPLNGARDYKVPKIAIVISDGNSADTQATKDEAKNLKDQGVTVFAIGVGNRIGRTELENIASNSRHVFQVQDFNGLNTIQDVLKKAVCSAAKPVV